MDYPKINKFFEFGRTFENFSLYRYLMPWLFKFSSYFCQLPMFFRDSAINLNIQYYFPKIFNKSTILCIQFIYIGIQYSFCNTLISIKRKLYH